MAQLKISIQDHIGWLVIDNPDRHNALTVKMWQSLPDEVHLLDQDQSVRVIVIRGEGGKAFSAGADISEFSTLRQGNDLSENATAISKSENQMDYESLNTRAFDVIRTSTKPTIAMIEGFCLGGGLAIALSCDIRMARNDARFGLPPAKLGLGYAPEWIESLLQAVPPHMAKEMLFTGKQYGATEALSMGLINHLLEEDSIYSETLKMAETIASNAPLTIQSIKQAINEISLNGRSADFDHLSKQSRLCLQSEDYAEGQKAFAEKRKPNFQGK